MSVTLLVLAAAAPDLAFDAYARCAQRAAVPYKGTTGSLEAVVTRVEADCASERSALLAVAPDKRQAAEWVRMTTTLAVTEHVDGLQSAGDEVKDDQAASEPAAASARYPKFDAYRQCGDEQVTKIVAEMPYMATDAIANEAIRECEKLLKPAAEELIAEMGQPGLRKQVTTDYRRRATTELTEQIDAQRASKK